MNIDWKLLREQKAYLIAIANEPTRPSSERATFDALINLIDAVQDDAVMRARELKEREVFGPGYDQ